MRSNFNLLWLLVFVPALMKLVGQSDWPWWLALAPVWIPAAGVVVVALPFYLAEAVRKNWRGR